MRIDIVNDAVQTKSGVSRKSGQPYSLREQEGVLVIGQYDMRPVRIPLGKDQPAYSKGTYTIDPKSFTVGNFGDLSIGRLMLAKPAQQAQQPQAARVAG